MRNSIAAFLVLASACAGAAVPQGPQAHASGINRLCPKEMTVVTTPPDGGFARGLCDVDETSSVYQLYSAHGAWFGVFLRRARTQPS